jgi:hypothetical protein
MRERESPLPSPFTPVTTESNTGLSLRDARSIRAESIFWTFLQFFCGLSTLKSCAHAARSTHTTQVTSA